MRDTEMFSIIGEEEERQLDNIELIASENFVSKEVREAQGSVLTNKYAEGYPGHRYYGGCVYVDKAEQLTKDRALALFGGEFVNVQPHSGAQANMAVYNAILQPGDTVLGMNLTSGGHLTHGSPVNFSGKLYHFISYDVNKETELIDYDELERIALETKPKLIVGGASAYPRIIDFKRYREIADKCGAYLMIDMAHIAGLVAAGLHPSPIPYADFVTTTTHKTLRGPRGGMVFCKEEFGKKLNSAVFPGMQGGPLEHVIAAKGVCLFEASQPSFKTYMEQTLKNVQVMVEGPGHMTIDEIAANMKLEKRLCHNAPFYVLGPLVTDIAPGYDHITSAIGGAIAAANGADFLCYVTPAEHLRLPNADDVKEGIVAAKIAAHAADMAKGVPGARDIDNKMSDARRRVCWDEMFQYAIEPEKPQ